MIKEKIALDFWPWGSHAKAIQQRYFVVFEAMLLLEGYLAMLSRAMASRDPENSQMAATQAVNKTVLINDRT